MVRLSLNKFKNFPLIILSFLAGSLVSLGTTAALAHGGNTAYIHGCVSTITGLMRNIAAGGTCLGTETALDWNQLNLPSFGGYTNLTGVNFASVDGNPRADFRNRDFSGANMSNSQFNKAYFAGANVTGVNFSNSDLSEVLFDGQFGNANFTTINFTNATLSATTLRNVNLTGQDFTVVDTLADADFSSSNLTNADFSGLTISYLNFTGANLTGADFSSVTLLADFPTANLANANFTGADIQNSLLTDVSGANTNFTNANLTGADFSGHTLTSPTWSNTICPDGTNSNSHSNTCAGHL